MKFFKLIPFLYFVLCGSLLFGQEDQKTVISILDFNLPTVKQLAEPIVYSEDSTEKKYQYGNNAQKHLNKLNRIKSFVIEIFGSDDRFVIVDRMSTDLIKGERELQKMEDFMDGYVVAQGKSLGADYLVSGEFDKRTRIFSLSIYSVADGIIKATETADLTMELFRYKPIKDPIVNASRRLIDREFQVEMPVVEITEAKKSKAKKLLVAAGLDRGMKKKLKLEIKVKDQREVNGKMMTYLKSIGMGAIDKVEGPHFSILKVEKGEKEVKMAMDAGKKVICTFVL